MSPPMRRGPSALWPARRIDPSGCGPARPVTPARGHPSARQTQCRAVPSGSTVRGRASQRKQPARCTRTGTIGTPTIDSALEKPPRYTLTVPGGSGACQGCRSGATHGAAPARGSAPTGHIVRRPTGGPMMNDETPEDDDVALVAIRELYRADADADAEVRSVKGTILNCLLSIFARRLIVAARSPQCHVEKRVRVFWADAGLSGAVGGVFNAE